MANRRMSRRFIFTMTVKKVFLFFISLSLGVLFTTLAQWILSGRYDLLSIFYTCIPGAVVLTYFITKKR